MNTIDSLIVKLKLYLQNPTYNDSKDIFRLKKEIFIGKNIFFK